MYTRCPACRSEISFEAPANAGALPEGYKHRIKCPNCGVTIGVKIHQIDAEATYTKPQPVEEEPIAAQEAVVPKKSGLGRNIVMMIISLLFVALNVVGYLIAKGTIHLGDTGWALGFTAFNGIGTIEALISGVVLPSDTVGILGIALPVALFGLACINFLVAFISACGKKYGRAHNVVFGVLIFAVAVLMLLYPFIANTEFVLADRYVLLGGAVLGLINLVLSLVFIKKL